MRTTTLIITLLLLAGCGPENSASAPQEELVLRTYEVPNGTAVELRLSIGNLLRSASEEGGNIGNTAVLDSGRIAVLAPTSIHEGVEDIIQKIGQSGRDEPSRIRFQIWLVKIQAGKNSNMPESLIPVQDSLQSVAENLGTATFSRIDYVEHIVRSGAQDASIGGHMLRGRVWDVLARGDKINAQFEFQSVRPGRPTGRIETEISFTTGETLVLGVVGAESQSEGDIFQAFVVRAERI